MIRSEANETGIVAGSAFRPAWWCTGPHLQTLWPYLFRRHPKPRYRRERVELPDGDFIDLDWHGPQACSVLVVILHGLEGSSSSHYVRALSGVLAERGMTSVVMHQRGCSGEPNRLARYYHAGETEDFRFVLERLRARQPESPLFAVGFSLGGNILLKWLGLSADRSLIAGAAAVSVPMLLEDGARRLERGLSRIYQGYLVGSMKRSVARKRERMPHPVDAAVLARCRTFQEIDNELTAPLHGFRDADDYYARSSSRQSLGSVAAPTLIIHARDDPFMTPRVIPEAAELSPSVRMEVSDSGGHCGFVSGMIPFRPRYWLDQRIPQFIESRLEHFPGPGGHKNANPGGRVIHRT